MSIDYLQNCIDLFARLPGFGHRSARRIVLYLMQNRDNAMLPLAKSLVDAANNVKNCEYCGNLDVISPCKICLDVRRNNSEICVIEEVADLWAIERCNEYRGKYHVLGGALSALDGVGPEQINIEKLIKRVANGEVKEVILATNATLDGQTTAHYITERLKGFNINISRIACGIPVGGELNYLDDGTLGAALKARRPF